MGTIFRNYSTPGIAAAAPDLVSRLGRLLTVTVCGVLATFGAIASTTDASEPPARVIQMRVAADSSMRNFPEWEQSLRDTVKVVSGVYEDNFSIRFEVLEVVPWDSDPELTDNQQRLDQFVRTVPRGSADIVVGFSNLECTGNYPGKARPFGTHAIAMASCPSPPGRTLLLEQVLSHQLAHLFGAFHVASHEDSVMTGGSTESFDRQTRGVIRLMADFDFKQGIDGVDATEKTPWTRIFDNGHQDDARNNLAVATRNLGMDLFGQGNLAGAEARFREAIRMDKGYAQPHTDLGMLLTERGQTEEAIAAYQSALAIDPDSTSARAGLIATMLQPGSQVSAVRKLQATSDLDPGNAANRLNLGLALLKDNKPDMAMTEFREVIRLDPYNALAHCHLGTTFAVKGKRAMAIESFRTAIEIDPDLGMAHTSLGYAYLLQGDLDNAISEYREALRINPDDQGSRANLEHALAQKKNLESQ